jgi:predicted nucleic acid-binding protein
VIVVDASAVVDYVALKQVDALPDRLTRSGTLHAPHLIDVEVMHAMRGLVARGELSTDGAFLARRDAAEMRMTLYPHALLLERAWQLRHTHSTYDAVYIALAELLPAPLVTCDARLAASHGHDAEIELFAPPA